jgi:putative ubiquitin-RnfH superfamily antitoxin RatB of RatAB toxin-antitoxin module
MSTAVIQAEVAYANPERQEILSIAVPEGTSVYEAVEKSGICERFPEIDLQQSVLGIFGKVVRAPREQVLLEGQRVEVYRPLKIDPKQARLNRARKN